MTLPRPAQPQDQPAAASARTASGQFQEAFHWSCVVGDHVGYAFVRAGSAGEAIDDYVPACLRARATALRVEKIRRRDIPRDPPDEG